MNIVLVSSKFMPEYSGSGLRAQNLYNRLKQKHPEITLKVISGSTSNNLSQKYRIDDMEVTRIAKKIFVKDLPAPFNYISVFMNFMSEFGETMKYLNTINPKPDLVHVFGKNNVTAAAVNYSLKNNLPLLLELCNKMDHPFQNIPFPSKYFIKNNFPDKLMIVCISEMLADVCAKNRIPKDKIWCRPNPVNEKKFYPVCESRKIELRKKLSGFSQEDKLIVAITKFRPKKNQLFLVETMKYLPPEYKLFLKGPLETTGIKVSEEKPYFEALIAEAQKNGMGKRIKIETGFCENVEEYYQMADVYAMPSIHEGLGTPILEAVACGIPVVATDLKGVTDVWIKNGHNGYISELNPELFAEKISKVVKIPPSTMKERSKEIIEKTGATVIDATYWKIINELIK